MPLISKKICFLGDYGVGKTSLIRRFVDRQFSDQYLSTIGVKISRKLVEIPVSNSLELQQVQLLIWDLEGRTKFHAITPSYLQGATGAVIVADVNRQETIDRIREHAQLAISANPKGIQLIVALNKADLKEDDSCKMSQFQENHPEILVTYMTSAKTGQNVDEIFQKLTHSMMKDKTT